MRAVEQKLWVKTAVGGVARYENDYYHRVSQDIATVPGNPWFICTMWLADYFISRAKSLDELKMALPIFEWTAAHAMESGVLAEQVNPYTSEPLSVSPLTWSHATVVSTAIKYLEKLEELQVCDTCHHPFFRLRRRGTVSVKSQAVFDRLDAEFDCDDARETAAAVAQFVKPAAHGAHDPRPTRATLAIDPKDCIGCDVCVAHCAKGVLRMVGGKAMVDLRNLDQCDLDGECVRICPTRVISLHTEPYVPAAHEALAELTAEEAARLDGPDVERALGSPIFLGPAGPGTPTPLTQTSGKAAKGMHLPILRI
jgi:ferredoxin